MATTKVELTDLEIAVISSALNDHLHEAVKALHDNNVLMSNGTRRPLGNIKKLTLQRRKELILPLIRTFENL